MKNSIVSKMLTCVLALTLIAGLFAGCGAQEEKESSVAGSQVVESSSSAETSKPSEVPVEPEKPEEPVKITIMHQDIGNLEEGSISDIWQKQIEEKLNIEIEWYKPASGYEEAIQVALLDENRPDVMILPNSWMTNTSFLDACETGLFTDISGLIEDYPNLMKWTAEASWEALDLFKDGRVWGFPRSTVARADGFVVKKEWVDKVGITVEEGQNMTLDDFFDLLYAFTYNDPDGNGINDTYGIRAYEQNGILFTGLERIFHVGGWYEFPDGTIDSVRYSKESDYYKQYLAFVNKCWEAGVIDPDAYALDKNAAAERTNLYYGIRADYPAGMNVTASDSKPYTEIYVPGVDVSGDPVGSYKYGDYSNYIWNFYAITKNCEHPEKVLELVDYMLSDEQWTNLNAQTLEGVGFVFDEKGDYDFSLTDKIKADDKTNGTMLRDTSLFTKFLRRYGAPEYFISKTHPAEVRERLSDLVQLSFDNYWPTLDRGYIPSVAKEQTYIEYENFIKSEESKIITGEKPVEYWDELLDGFYKAGYEEYRKDMLEYIASFE